MSRMLDWTHSLMSEQDAIIPTCIRLIEMKMAVCWIGMVSWGNLSYAHVDKGDVCKIVDEGDDCI